MNSRGLAVATISTRSHLSWTLTMVQSLRATWTRDVAIYVALVDGTVDELPAPIAAADVTALDASKLAGLDWPWLVAKFNAMELSCAIKPFVVRTLLDAGHDAVYYVDGDVLFLNDGGAIADYRPHSPFVVVPHMLSPLAHDPQRLRPSMGDIAVAGMMNAGMFLARESEATRHFLALWGDLTTRPGACLPELMGVVDQQAFNWVTSFVDDVAVLRDPCVNVAYWNLHERPVRAAALDGGDPTQWTIDGQPVSSFHFSGFRGDSGVLSIYDAPGAAGNPNIDVLCSLYAERLAEAERELGDPPPYAYGTIDGIVISDWARVGLRQLEITTGRPLAASDAWTDVARTGFASLPSVFAVSPAPLIPEYVFNAIRARIDLARLFEPGALFAFELLSWLASASFAREHNEGRFYERETPFAIARVDVARLATACVHAVPGLSIESAMDLLLNNRSSLLAQLAPSQLADEIAIGRYRSPAHDPACCLRHLHWSRHDLRSTFPDPLGDDRDAFAVWLRERLTVEYDVPPDVALLAANLDVDSSLARILGRVQRHPDLRERVRAGGLDVDIARALRPEATGEHGFSMTDLVLAEWWVQGRSEGERRTRSAAVFPVRSSASTAAAVLERDLDGINVFGQFKSPNGLGSLSRGFVTAAAAAGYRCDRIVLTNATMDDDLTLADLSARGTSSFARDLVVSFPHIDFDLFDAFPDALGTDRETVAYLAWEQRDCNRRWAQRFERFDRLFALSTFAADSIANAFGRPCDVLPSVVQLAETADPARDVRLDFGIPDDAFVVGTMLDVASGFDRKNPLAAAHAVALAFKGRRDVFFVMKASNGDWPEHASRLRQAVKVLDDAGINHLMLTSRLERRDVDALMSTLDLYLSLHRAEGFGYTIAEAMLHGVPVVATGYSGNMDFMTTTNSYPVAFHEVLVTNPEGPFARGTVWANPDVEDAAEKCRHVFENRSEAFSRATQGRSDVARLCSPTAVGARLRTLLS